MPTIDLVPGMTLASAKARRMTMPKGEVVTIRLAAGEWRESVTMPPNTVLEGLGPATRVIGTTGPALQWTGDNMGRIGAVGLTAVGHAGAEAARVVGAAESVCFSSIRVEGGAKNIAIVGGAGTQRITLVAIADCILLDADGVGHPQGVYLAKVDDYAIADTFIHRPGAAKADIFCHGIYVQSDCGPGEICGNTIVGASSHGIQQRGGGTLRGNLVVNCPCGIHSWGPGYEVVNNVVIESGEINPSTPRGKGIEVFPGNGSVTGNVIGRLNSRTAQAIWCKTNAVEYQFESGEVTIERNVSDIPIALGQRPGMAVIARDNIDRGLVTPSLADYANHLGAGPDAVVAMWRTRGVLGGEALWWHANISQAVQKEAA